MERLCPDGEVFVVDNDKDAINWFRRVLEPAGYAVEAYESAEGFLCNYDSTRVGCVIVEAELPDVSGLELQQRLRSEGWCVPVIFVARNGGIIRSIVEAFRNGAIDYLQKPVDKENLLEAVRQAIEADRKRHRLNQEHSVLRLRLKLLTPREQQVMDLLFAGKTLKTIAAEFRVSIQTVSRHRAKVLEKLQVQNEAELVRLLLSQQPDRR